MSDIVLQILITILGSLITIAVLSLVLPSLINKQGQVKTAKTVTDTNYDNSIDPKTVAAITAAINCCMEAESKPGAQASGFIVRSIRKRI